MKKILIISQNKNDQALLTYYINKYFVAKLFIAENQIEAVKFVDMEPDIIIYDVLFDDGKNFIEYFKSKNTNAKIIGFNNFENDLVNTIINKSNVFSELGNPFNSFTLYEKIEKYIKVPAVY